MNTKLKSLNKDKLLTIVGKLSKKELIDIINQKMVIEQMGGNNDMRVSSKHATRKYIIPSNKDIENAEQYFKKQNNIMKNDNAYKNMNNNSQNK